MKAIILAGGFGTRLRERVPNLPKPMAPVAGRPFLEYLLDRLISSGINEVIISVGYRSKAIINHFGNSYRNIQIDYSIESEPLGTGGAIIHALRKNNGKSESVIVLNGDTLLNINFSEFIDLYTISQFQIAIVLKKVTDVSRYGAVLISNDKITGFIEKGKVGAGLINAGVYILNQDIFKHFDLPRKFSFEADLLQKYCAELSPTAFSTESYFIDIGIPSDYERAQLELPKLL